MFFKYLFIIISIFSLFIISSCKKTITDPKPLDATISTWPKVGTGLSGSPEYLYIDPSGTLYSAGWTNYSNYGYSCGTSVSFVSKLNGNTWNQLGTGSNALNVNGPIRTMCGDASGNIYVAGSFTDSTLTLCSQAGNNYVAKWNGVSWSMLGTKGSLGVSKGTINSIAINPTTGYLFVAVSSYFNQVNEVVFWNGNSWHILDSATTKLSGSALKLCFDHAGNLYACGGFSNNNAASFIVKWNGTSWIELGNPNPFIANGPVLSICTDAAGNLFAGGWFRNVDYKPYIIKWDGTTWTDLGAENVINASGGISTMCFDVAGNLYVAGYLTYSVTALDNTSYVAKWDGNSWSILGKNTLFASGISCLVPNPSGGIYVTGGLVDANNQNYVGRYP